MSIYILYMHTLGNFYSVFLYYILKCFYRYLSFPYSFLQAVLLSLLLLSWCDKDHYRTKLGEERIRLTYTSSLQSITEGSQCTNSNRNWNRNNGGMLLTDFLSWVTHPASFNLSGPSAHRELGTSTLIVNQENALQTCLQSGRSFLSTEVSFYC